MRRLGILFALVTLLLGAGGCGSTKHGPAGGEQARELDAHRAQLKGVPNADRSAYYEIATTAGLLRARSALLAHGRSNGRVEAQLRAARGVVARTRPRARALGALRAQLLVVLRRSAPRTRAAARRELVFVDSVTAALNRFVRHDPRFTALQPD